MEEAGEGAFNGDNMKAEQCGHHCRKASRGCKPSGDGMWGHREYLGVLTIEISFYKGGCCKSGNGAKKELS